jgi:hypothetical protein
MKATFLLNGAEVIVPNNFRELAIQLNFDQGNPTAQVSLNEWEFGVGTRNSTTDSSLLLNNHLDNGLTGGVGAFEGVPFGIDLEDNNVKHKLFDGYIDPSTAVYNKNLVTGTAVEQGGIDWLNEIADSVSIEFLATAISLGGAGIIKDTDNILVPYIISEIPNNKDAAIMALTIFVVITEIKSAINELIKSVNKVISDPLMWGEILAIIIQVAYILVLIITSIKLIIDLFNLIIQPVKYHAGMNVLFQCQKAADYLGFTFESTILDVDYKDLLILPTKNAQFTNENSNSILGFLNKDKTEHNGFYRGTFGDLLRELKTMFNAKVVIDGTIIRLERRDYNLSNSLYQLPDVDQTKFSLNADEFISNYSLAFSVDYNDKNTVNEYAGTAVQVQTLPKTINNKGMVLTKGFQDNTLQFALGKIKNELTRPERIVSAFFKVAGGLLGEFADLVNKLIPIINTIIKKINKLVKQLNNIPGINLKVNLKPLTPITIKSFANLIEDRIGMLKMENDFISVSKMLIIKEGNDARNNKPTANNSVLLDANYLFETYHSINSFDSETYPAHNQHINRSIENIPFCFEDYEKVRTDNKIYDNNGVDIGELLSLEWNPFTKIATSIKFKINKVYTKNLKTTVIIPA